MKYLIRVNFGLRNAFGETLEIVTEEEYNMIQAFSKTGDTIDFGEIEGKHSEVMGPLAPSDFRIVSTDQNDIETFQKLIGKKSYFGAFSVAETLKTMIQEGEWDYEEKEKLNLKHKFF